MGLLVTLLLVSWSACASASVQDCWLSSLVGQSLVDSSSGAARSSCAVSAPLVGLLFASSMCESCVAFQSHVAKLASFRQTLQVVLLSRDPNQKRFDRHLLALGESVLAIPLRSEDSERLNVHFGKPSLPTLMLFTNDGRLLDAHGYHTLLHLGPDKALEYWNGRANHAQEVNHRDLYLAAHPANQNLLAKLQPAANNAQKDDL